MMANRNQGTLVLSVTVRTVAWVPTACMALLYKITAADTSTEGGMGPDNPLIHIKLP